MRFLAYNTPRYSSSPSDCWELPCALFAVPILPPSHSLVSAGALATHLRLTLCVSCSHVTQSFPYACMILPTHPSSRASAASTSLVCSLSYNANHARCPYSSSFYHWRARPQALERNSHLGRALLARFHSVCTKLSAFVHVITVTKSL